MKVKCWGKSPKTGACSNIATRYFVSNITVTPGITPANRAVCQDCFGRYCFDFFIKIGEISEVTESEWQEHPEQYQSQERIEVLSHET